MANSPDNLSMALFCDFENVALGVRDANYEKFDIKPVLERLLLKGSIVVKKAYCDWDRYKGFKATMHEANFELIEIPHVRQSGKNSADIRMVVDALDLCYTKSHVNTFVIISGDSDFSPLVSKLRENNKQVIGVGVKQSTSDLLIANCDEFIFYDDLVREKQRALARRQQPADAPQQARRTPEEERKRKEASDARRSEALELAVETFDALMAERGDSGKIWASVLKEAIKRRRPDFNENYFGFRTFGNLLEEARNRGLMEFGRDDKSGAYVFRSSGGGSTGTAPLPAAGSQASVSQPFNPQASAAPAPRAEQPYERPVSRYFPPEAFAPAPAPTPAAAPVPTSTNAAAPVTEAPEHEAAPENDEQPPASYGRDGREPRESREGREGRDGRTKGGRRGGQRDNRFEPGSARSDAQPAQQSGRTQGQIPAALSEHDAAIAAAAAEAEARARARKARELREREEQQTRAATRRAAAPAPEDAEEPAALAPAPVNEPAQAESTEEGAAPATVPTDEAAAPASPRRRSRGGRSGAKARAQANAAQAEAENGTMDDTSSGPAEAAEPAAPSVLAAPEPAPAEAAPVEAAAPAAKKARRPRAAAKKAG